MDSVNILGETIVGEVMGAGAGSGFDSSFLINAAAELAQRGVDTYQTKQQAEKSAREVEGQTQKAIAADRAWANAEVDLEIAKKDKDAGRIAATQAVASMSAEEAASAGAGLPPEAVKKRVAAGQDAAKVAAKTLVGDPHNVTKAAYVHAWQKIVAAGMSGGGGSSDAMAMMKHGGGGGGEGNFFTKVHAGIPTWGWFAGGAVVLTGGILLVRSLLRR